ncbi:DNA replication and repair protein RecF [Lactiplantibacillus plantarum]|uniref:AAA family ATPase n=1 Tax=Lactiplantibacillus plantarum TaxID=1590 RepID=UPI0007E4516C|nr:AAA family ATPase [Lactiplantibacillus plantarum]ANJ12772.1 hypothetical protein A8704_01565 [Lactiplantibacillus plantarum]MCB7175701.1 AAA family ATPase [Lactiplantibacillus plantarum]MCG0628312.1 DNA replication and repair protein RecF [Lactiplantibacillus plantarum]MCG0694412.1 DNA replication and repair protein RecF [Lactiplantibacillus plantarum]
MSKIKVLEAGMKLKKIDLKNVGNISDLSLTFNEHMNVICGTNGIGKTTILKALKALFVFSENDLKLKYGTENGSIKATSFKDSTRELSIKSVFPADDNRNSEFGGVFKENAVKVIVNPDNRSLDYHQLNTISRYPVYNSSDVNNRDFLENNVNNTLKTWFINRIIAEKMDDGLSESEKYNIRKMKESVSIIDSNIKYKRVDVRDLEILLNDHGSEVFFEFESTGFKNILFIILGIIEEIEFRFKNMKIVDFNGIILIDEVELHLHPAWQNKIIDILSEMFPNAQFIMTTHSPAVLQSLDSQEIIPLHLNDGNVEVKTLDLSKYGLKGWTLEEILSDVMGVGMLKNKVLQDSLDSFSNALDDDNVELAKKEYEQLNEMLHPESELRQILEIQKAGLF